MVFKRPGSAYYWYEFTLDGKRYRASTKRTNRRQAEEVEREEKRRVLDMKQLGLKDAWSVGDALTKWWEAKGQRMPAGRSMRYVLDRLVGQFIRVPTEKVFTISPGTPLHTINARLIGELVDARRSQGWEGATINREISCLRSVIAYAKGRGAMIPSDMDEWERQEENKKTRWLTEEEEGRLLSIMERSAQHSARSQDMRDSIDITVTLLDTGARLGEILSLSWDCVDLDGGVIHLYRSKTGNASVLGMTDRVREVMTRRISRRTPGAVWVFPADTVSGHRADGLPGVRRAIEEAGLNAPHLVERYGRCTVHTFRHTYASRLVQSGLDLHKVQVLLGHTNPQMTQRYAHLAKGDVASEAVRILQERRRVLSANAKDIAKGGEGYPQDTHMQHN